jgi:UDP-2,3-diacylglucosamine pyrophosphatase LpxH
VPDRYRTIWISDLHLGTRSANADAVLDFLDTHAADRYYLVGDIVDGWALRRSWYWPPSHSELLKLLLDRATRSEMIGPVHVQRYAKHRTADDRTLVVLHGDEFDGVVGRAPWLSRLGGWLYRRLRALNRQANRLRGWLNKPRWRLAAAAKVATKRVVQSTADFDAAVVRRVRREGADGIVCGHIHLPEVRQIEGVTYANSGDWVEHCTVLVEHPDGRLELLRWAPAAGRVRSTGDGAPSATGAPPFSPAPSPPSP